MANHAEQIKKLVELALCNPNEHEAASAAIMACRIIKQFQIPVGDMVVQFDERKEWVPPSADYMSTVADIFNGKAKNPDADPIPQSEGGPGYDGRLMIQDRDVDTKENAFAAQVVRAWRAIRGARKKLEAEIYRYEQETRRKYRGEGW